MIKQKDLRGVRDTFVEEHSIPWGSDLRKIYVKREDRCLPWPGPSFSKMRGCYAHIKDRPEKIIGVLDTFHSKAGWAVAYNCALLGKACINFWPRYKKDEPGKLRYQQKMSKTLGAILREIPAGRSFILYNQVRTIMKNEYPAGYLMPNALKLDESITENAKQVTEDIMADVGDLVISVSSGTIAAGVLRGFLEKGFFPRVHLHMGYSREPSAIWKYIEKKAKIDLNLFKKVNIIDEGYNYKDPYKGDHVAPFPCNPYYDAKAWGWLCKNQENLPGKILFWNIGD